MAGRNSRLNDAEFCQLVAEAYTSGMSSEAMAEELDCHRDTVYQWIKDPRVQIYITRLTRERVNRITRKVDSEIEGRLSHVSNMKIDELLKIRKEYLERTMKTQGEVDSAATTNEVAEAMDQNPDLAEALRALVEQG
jgi:transposase